MSDHLEVIRSLLKGPCGVQEPVRTESRLVEDLGLDSVGMLALAVGLENHYQMRLGEDPDNPPETVADVMELLSVRLGDQET